MTQGRVTTIKQIIITTHKHDEIEKTRPRPVKFKYIKMHRKAQRMCNYVNYRKQLSVALGLCFIGVISSIASLGSVLSGVCVCCTTRAPALL